MNCYYHNENSAVAQCSNCSKGLCGSCSKKFTILICTECNNRNWKYNHKRNLWGIFYFFLYFVLLSFFIGSFLFEYLLYKAPFLHPIIILILLIYAMLGWAASFRYYSRPSDNRITKADIRRNEHTWVADLVTWIIKFLYYGLIGPVILPLWIRRTGNQLKAYKEYRHDYHRIHNTNKELVN